VSEYEGARRTPERVIADRSELGEGMVGEKTPKRESGGGQAGFAVQIGVALRPIGVALRPIGWPHVREAEWKGMERT
jgi:hypothetical protein